MKDIQASEAKTHLPQILDEVERGEVVRITRHGRPIARIVPEESQRRKNVDQVVARIKALQKRTGEVTVEELLSAKHQGHRF
jgi:prevent-host-death family protein